MIKERRIAILLTLALGSFACGKKKNNDDKPKADEGLGVSATIDEDLAGTWEIDVVTFKIEKTINSNGQAEEKIWEDGSLNFHTKSKITQDNDGETKRFIDEVLTIEVATGSFEGAQAGFTQKCLYKVEEKSKIVLLRYICNESYPTELSAESNTLMKK